MTNYSASQLITSPEFDAKAESYYQQGKADREAGKKPQRVYGSTYRMMYFQGFNGR